MPHIASHHTAARPARTLAPLIGGFLNDNLFPQAIWIGGLLIGLTSALGLTVLNNITKSRAALHA